MNKPLSESQEKKTNSCRKWIKLIPENGNRSKKGMQTFYKISEKQASKHSTSEKLSQQEGCKKAE